MKPWTLQSFRVLLAIGVLSGAGCGGFGSLTGHLVEANPRGLEAVEPSEVPPGALRLTYLGTQGYLLESGSTSLLIDPFLSRPPLWRVALDAPIAPQAGRLEKFLARLRHPPQMILITHGHYDHLLDAPEILKRTPARLAGSETTVRLARAAGAAPQSLQVVRPGDRLEAGQAKIRVLPARHDRLCCSEPFPGEVPENPAPPSRPSHWRMGEPLAYLIEWEGRRIYVDSGGRVPVDLPDDLGPVDLAIAGVALPDSRRRLAELLAKLNPRIFLPGHQDDFFRPLEDGFHYGAMTDPAGVKKIAAGRAEMRLIVLDYFAPWLLP